VTASHYLPTISSQRTNTQSHISFSTFDMTDQSGSPHLRVLFEAALEDYKQQTGIELAKHPLAEHLEDCNSVESVTAILRAEAQDFKEFREKDKLLKPLRKVLTVLHRLSSAADFAQDVGLVCP
jgi:fungal STAND N-terminal Goodbye domain